MVVVVEMLDISDSIRSIVKEKIYYLFTFKFQNDYLAIGPLLILIFLYLECSEMYTFQNIVAWRISFIPAKFLFEKANEDTSGKALY